MYTGLTDEARTQIIICLVAAVITFVALCLMGVMEPPTEMPYHPSVNNYSHSAVSNN